MYDPAVQRRHLLIILISLAAIVLHELTLVPNDIERLTNRQTTLTFIEGIIDVAELILLIASIALLIRWAMLGWIIAALITAYNVVVWTFAIVFLLRYGTEVLYSNLMIIEIPSAIALYCLRKSSVLALFRVNKARAIAVLIIGLLSGIAMCSLIMLEPYMRYNRYKAASVK